MRGTVVLALAAVLVTASFDAAARGGRGYHHHHARFGVFIGAPVLLSPFWLAPGPYYYSPPVVVRERVVVREPLVFYDEHGNPVPPDRPQSQQQPQPTAEAPTWFYCPDTQSYYPYVQTCASQWQRVMPHPPPR